MSESEFSAFLNDEVATRFRDGLTVTDEQGGAGARFYGPLKRVTLVLSGRPDDAAQVEAIRAAYAAKFHKETGLDMSRAECGSP